jgi:hypothetical protein
MQFLQAYLFHKISDILEEDGQNHLFSFGKGRDWPARKAANLTAISEPIVKVMWDP